MSRFDFIMRREGKNFDPEAIYDFSLALPAETTLADALTAAWAAGMSKGSQRSGCFQVQCDAGVWDHKNQKAIRLNRLADAPFRSWEAIEAAEVAAA